MAEPINFDRILPGDFDEAIARHLAGENNIHAWRKIAKDSPALSAWVHALRKKFPSLDKLPAHEVAAVLMMGVEAGYYLGAEIKDRRIEIFR